MHKLISAILGAVCMVVLVGVAPAKAAQNPPTIPIAGPTVSGTYRYESGGQIGTMTLVAPAEVVCNVSYPTCLFNAFVYVDLPNQSGTGFPDIIGTYAGNEGKIFGAPVESNGKLVTLGFDLTTIKKPKAFIQFRGNTLPIDLTVNLPKNIKVLTSKALKSKCSKKDATKWLKSGDYFAICNDYSVKNKTFWEIHKSTALLSDAFNGCALKRSAASLGDRGKTLTLSGVFKWDEPLNESDWACVSKIVKIPDSVQSQMSQTRALDGRQSAKWGSFNASWTFHPDDGLNVILTMK